MNGASLQSANRARLGLIGNPENRRILDFQRTAQELGFPVPLCLSYEQLLRDPDSLAHFDVELIRVDSPGENESVTRGLIARGGGPASACFEFGEIAYARECYRGFCSLLEAMTRKRALYLNSPGDIAVMFDKWECHRLFVEQDVPRPRAELAPLDFPSLREQMRARQNGRVFLKPLHGSSASGVCALRWTGARHQLIAPLRVQAADAADRPILVNSLDVRTYTTLAEIEVILGILLPQGMIMEQWVPKLTLANGAIDLRVLVIAGEARHWVIRQSQYPMTNLHLGNRRGDEAALMDVIGTSNLEAAFNVAEKAAACFPNSLYAGVDVLIDSRHRPLVAEINAFGDLLPRLTHRGESAYAAIFNATHVQSVVTET
jgi:hypothetical protein